MNGALQPNQPVVAAAVWVASSLRSGRRRPAVPHFDGSFRKLMPRSFRYGLILFMIAALAAMGALFGSYPSTGLPEDTVMISVSRTTSRIPIFSVTAPDELQTLKDLAGTIWSHFGYNSLDGPEHYRLTLTTSDGQSRSFWITPTEWSDHGITPKGFFDLLSKLESEKIGAPNH
jgi:hypothetical protein